MRVLMAAWTPEKNGFAKIKKWLRKDKGCLPQECGIEMVRRGSRSLSNQNSTDHLTVSKGFAKRAWSMFNLVPLWNFEIRGSQDHRLVSAQ